MSGPVVSKVSLPFAKVACKEKVNTAPPAVVPVTVSGPLQVLVPLIGGRVPVTVQVMVPEELFEKPPGVTGSFATTVNCTVDFPMLKEPVYVASW